MSFKSIIKIFIFVIFHAVISNNCIACALSRDSLNKTPSFIYTGDIDVGAKRIPISMYIRFDQSSVTAHYSYTNSTGDIPLQGKLADDGKAIELQEVAKNGAAGEKFIGQFVEYDPRDKTPGDSKLNCEVIVGNWYNGNSQHPHPLYLRLSASASDDPNHQYSYNGGVEDDEIIHKAVSQLKSAIKKNDKKAVASMVHYPITVNIDGGRRTIKNKAQLIKLYDKIFTSNYKDKILKAFGRNLFARNSAIMLGNGEVWFMPSGKILTLNNH